MLTSMILMVVLAQATPEGEVGFEEEAVFEGEDALDEEAPREGELTLEEVLLSESTDLIEYLFVRGALELSALAFLERSSPYISEGFLSLRLNLTVDGGDRFGVVLEAPLRLRVFEDFGGARGSPAPLWRLRAQDWDERSDFGQLLHYLRLGSDYTPVRLEAGRMEDYTLRSGHLVRRYSNQENPNYHPSGAFLTAYAGPLYTELFTADLLGARLVAGELALDVGSWLGAAPTEPFRHSLGVSLAHDFARAGGASPPVTLAHVDISTGLFYQPDFQVSALAGAGTRLDGPGSPVGAVAGLSLETFARKLMVRGRLEARMQRGGFRQGFFGPLYELSRFLAPGPSSLPAAREQWPDGFSGFGELMLGWDSLSLEHGERELNLSLAAEAFSWGRVDADARVERRLLVRRLRLALRVAVEGLLQPRARHLITGEVRYRFRKRVYLMAQAGTVFFPLPGSGVHPSAFVSLGVGADYIR